jgi:hypothetical protein
MSQILYWNDVAAGVRHATLVHSQGHILLRNVPTDKVDQVNAEFKVFRDGLTSIPDVTDREIVTWLEAQGYQVDANFNPPIIAFTFFEEADLDAEGEGNTIRDMSLRQLRKLATELGIADPKSLDKEALVLAIEAAEAAKSGETQ